MELGIVGITTKPYMLHLLYFTAFVQNSAFCKIDIIVLTFEIMEAGRGQKCSLENQKKKHEGVDSLRQVLVKVVQ